MNTQSNTTDKITQLVGELADAWNRHDIERTIRLYAANYHGIDISEIGPRHGQEGAREWIKRYWDASPDMHFTCEQTVVQGNRAAVSWRAQGTHRGYLMNIPPTGRVFTVRGVSFLTIQDNQIQRAEYIWDLAELLRCIRLLPELHE
jgi:steroid delta-isomerase-like uncharacterized protein